VRRAGFLSGGCPFPSGSLLFLPLYESSKVFDVETDRPPDFHMCQPPVSDEFLDGAFSECHELRCLISGEESLCYEELVCDHWLVRGLRRTNPSIHIFKRDHAS
jgi:hypothetical protein